MEDDEEQLTLPADTLQALQEFMLTKSQREFKELELIENKAGKVATFEEDWQLSQFWYDDDTKDTLAKVVHHLLVAENNTKQYSIALLSCPSLYAKIKELHENVKIFEFDKRFSAYGDDFVFYDYNDVESEQNYLSEHYQRYDLIIADPPFLSEKCISKMSKIIKNMRKSPTAKIIFCSGETVAAWITQQLNLQQSKFRPQHARNLGNEFACYTNFNINKLL